MSLQIGESVGHYQIVEELGAGGSGRVLKVEHLITRRSEAMKILAKGKPTSQESAHRFLREIRLQASLDHPNIAAVLNAFWLEDDLVMVMELIEGNTLQQLLCNRRFNLDQSMHLIRQVLDALIYAHARSVVHRDVSTANIIVSAVGRVKLTDFGLAKGAADLSITDSGGMIGSPYYISPEQVRGSAAPDQRSDIYSTGVVLYELLTGTRPFEGDSTFLLMQAHVQQLPQAPIERNAAIPQFISDAILRALAKNPQDRFQTAAEFLSAVDGPTSVTLNLIEAPPPPELVLMVAPPPAANSNANSDAPSHSYAAPIPADDNAVRLPGKRSLGRRLWASPLTGAILGIGVVIAAIAPVVFYDFESGKPRFSSNPKAPSTAPALRRLPPEPIALTPGPKEVPVFPQGASARALRPAASPRRPVTQKALAPPPIVVWGEAKAPAMSSSSPDAQTKQLEQAASPPATPLRSAPPTPVIEPQVPTLVADPARKSIFRRLTDGVKSLNPIHKYAPAAAVPPAKP